ncbi:MAG: site-2 protease family protein [Planctomycetota bacterium]
MLFDLIQAALPLAATEDGGMLTSLATNIVFAGRVALGIGLVIFVHELGHFVAAKTFGVKCEKFYVGFDVPIQIGPIKFPRTLGKFRYGETEYGIGVIPLGGYVKMLGQDDDPRKAEEEAKRIKMESDDDGTPPPLDPRSFPAKPVWQRMIIISAGVVMNVITGVLFAAVAFGFGVSYSPAVVGGVMPGGPAWQAGIEPGGRIVSVGTWQDQEMHFIEMRREILTRGLENPEESIDLEIEYASGTRKIPLKTQPRPDLKDARMIGLSVPTSLVLGSKKAAYKDSIAATVLGEEDAGAKIIAFDGTEIDESAIVPGTPFFDYLFSNPNKTIRLKLRRSDDSVHEVDLPPQKSRSLGLRFTVGPIVAMVKGGPAEKAGLLKDDVIVKFNDVENPYAYSMATDLVGANEPVLLTVERGEAKEIVEINITPEPSLQTISPTESISGEIAINSLGFAYRPLPTVAAVNEGVNVDVQPGDVISEVKLSLDEDNLPEWAEAPEFERILEELQKGWEFSPTTTLSDLRLALQQMPVGTKLNVTLERPTEDGSGSGKVIPMVMTLTTDDQVMFRRGLVLAPTEAIQTASSINEALALGMKEGMRRFNDVIRFLRMLPRGRIKLRHVGGPVEIVRIASSEASKGISQQLLFLTMLSMNLAILNFLPIPALDGGHMMFLLYELVAGKRANEQLEFRLTVVGLLALLTLMAVVIAGDIVRLFTA